MLQRCTEMRHLRSCHTWLHGKPRITRPLLLYLLSSSASSLY